MAVQHKKQRLILGISGASGVIYGVRLLEKLRDSDIETHLVMTKAAEMTLASETPYKPADIYKLADTHHPIGHVGASIASGSFKAMGMIVAPCSVKTMSEIACGIGGNLLTRAADVCLKERRRLVLMVRETPLHTGHLRRMTELSEMGAVIAPPAPGFYTQPETIDDLIDQSVGRLLDLFGIESGIPRWGEEYGLTSQD